jgi:cytochrome P450
MASEGNGVLTAPPTKGAAAECPFDPYSAEAVRNPFPFFAEVRETAPVFYVPSTKEWWVTRFEDCLAVIRDTETYSSRNVVQYQDFPELDERLEHGHPHSRPLVNTDPPDHSRLRRVSQKAFTPKAIKEWEPEAVRYSQKLIDAVKDRGSMELISEFSQPLTMRMICLIVGTPQAEAPRFRRWITDMLLTDAASPPLPTEERDPYIERVIGFDGWINDFIEERRRDPQDDLTSVMVSATDENGEPALTTWEIARLVVNILSAGFETSASTIASAVYLLLSNPEQFERVKAEPGLAEAVVDEALRLENPVWALRRYVTRDTTLGGAAIPAGATVIISLASSMRDGGVFANPDTFDLERAELNEQFGFGKWTHFCLGAPLARMEVRVALQALAENLPNLRLGAGETASDRWPNPIFAGFNTMRVEW